jgi:signal transduction histidine kinase/ligand-binding sensor domain-containing protein
MKRRISRLIFFPCVGLVLLLIGAAGNPHLFSQSHPTPSRIKFNHLSVESGLSQNSVYVVYQDREGFMWFGTADGLNRYDGYSFTVFKHHQSDTTSLSNSTIRSVFEDSKGNLWVGTDNGLNLFNRSTGTFHKFILKNEDSTNAIIGGIGSIYEDKTGTLFFGSNSLVTCTVSSSPQTALQHFYVYENGDAGNTSTFALGEINDIFEDMEGRLWLATSNGLWSLDRDKKTFLSYPLFGEPRRPLKLSVNSIVEYEPNTLWLGTNNNGYRLVELHFPSHIVRQRKLSAGMPTRNSPVSSIQSDNNGTIWVGSYGEGIFRVVQKTGKAIQLVHDAGNSNSVSFDLVKTIFIDRSGIIWIGTDGGGVSYVDPHRKQFVHYVHNPFDSNSPGGNFLKAVYEDRKGRLWIGAIHGGLDRFDTKSGTWKHYRHNPLNRNSIANDNVFSIVEDDAGRLWLAEGSGLDALDPVTEIFTHFTLPQHLYATNFDDVHALAFDDKKNLWIAADGGVFIKHKGTNRIIYIAKLPDDLWALHYSSTGTMWGGGAGGGLIKIDTRTLSVVRYSSSPSATHALSNGNVRSIWEDSSGILWLGTEEGLNRFDPRNETFTHYTEKDGLVNDFIYGILGDGHGDLWISSNGGMSRFSPQNPPGKQFWNFDVNDGLQANEFNTGAYCKGNGDEMFFGGVNGLTAFFPDSIRRNPNVPPVVITEMVTTKGNLFREGSLTAKDTVILNYDNNDFMISFVALNYTQPEKNQYAYKLEGLEGRWVNAGTERQARFTNIDPGEYVFRVKASNNDGIWNDAGATLRIYIVPPYWATWWFRLLVLIAVLGAVGGAARYITLRRVERKIQELQHQRALEYERTRISQDMHDEIGSSLTQIAILSELVKRDLHPTGSTENGDKDSAEKQVEKISETARSVVDSMSQIIWAIDPKNDKLENLTAYLHEYLAEYFEMAGISTRFKLGEAMPALKLTAKFRRNVFLTAKEAANNIVKHAGATSVDVELRIENHEFNLVMCDNGKGFDPSKISGFGNGLMNMRKRIEALNGEFTLDSCENKGTKAIISVPLQKDV